MITCTKCRSQIPDNKRFCRRCGAPVPPLLTGQVVTRADDIQNRANNLLWDNSPSRRSLSSQRQSLAYPQPNNNRSVPQTIIINNYPPSRSTSTEDVQAAAAAGAFIGVVIGVIVVLALISMACNMFIFFLQ